MRPLAFLPLSEKQLQLLHRSLYLLGLMTLACGLAWSNALMSIGQFILAGNWLLEGQYVEKWQNFKKDPLMQLLLSFMLMVMIGFLWTDNFNYAWKDARIKLPLFLMPYLIGSSPRLKKGEWKIILGVYLSTLFLLYLSSLAKYFGIIGDSAITDKRELSIFISHIRYGLNLLLGAILAFYYAKLYGKKLMPLMLVIGLILCSSLMILELYTALGIGLAICFYLLARQVLKSEKRSLKFQGMGLIAIVILAGATFFLKIYNDFQSVPTLSYDQELLNERTANGRKYYHDEDRLVKENGVYLWRYIQKKELKKEWKKRSEISIDSTNLKGNKIYHTLIRFLSSKGLTKDSVGLSQLSDAEIRGIENGVPNVYYLNHLPIQNRVYSTLYELQIYREFNYAEGFSLAMRLEFWKTAWRIVQKQPVWGVGTGDVQDAFALQYHIDDSSLSDKNRRRAHNQFLTILLTFGIFGLIYFFYYLIVPLIKVENPFYPIFFLIVFLSFFTEDTLETQAGVTFFAYFNSLFALGLPYFKTEE